MKKRHKLYLKLNLVSLVFIVVSLIFTTLAWFAYSGLSSLDTEIGVKAWYIELSKNGEAVSNNVVISIPTIYPGMDTITEKINIQNHGDSIAQVKYDILSARILDTEYNTEGNNNITSNDLETSLSHNYPFHININLSNYVVESNVGTATFEVSASWPLDGGNDTLDSQWGTKAYEFNQSEQNKLKNNPDYDVEAPIQVVIKVTAEQYVEGDNASSIDYAFGNTLLYDVVEDNFCTKVSDTCLSTTVIDENNKLGDETITVIPNILNKFTESTFDNYNDTLNSVAFNWNVEYSALTAGDILKIISKDIESSNMITPTLSNIIVGSMNSSTRVDEKLNKASSLNGYFEFMNDKFKFLYDSSGSCYWTMTDYNTLKGYAFSKIDAGKSKLYGESKTTSCQVLPVIKITKKDLTKKEKG